jgi:hypothetical protein
MIAGTGLGQQADLGPGSNFTEGLISRASKAFTYIGLRIGFAMTEG